jgi:hypothetical protein
MEPVKREGKGMRRMRMNKVSRERKGKGNEGIKKSSKES